MGTDLGNPTATQNTSLRRFCEGMKRLPWTVKKKKGQCNERKAKRKEREMADKCSEKILTGFYILK